MTLQNYCNPEKSPGINQSAKELRRIHTGQKTNENGRPDGNYNIHDARLSMIYKRMQRNFNTVTQT